MRFFLFFKKKSKEFDLYIITQHVIVQVNM
jgi:hypothetical protein